MRTVQEEMLKNRVEKLKNDNRTLRKKITALKKEDRLAAKALKEARELLNNTPVALLLIQEEKIILANETAQERLGYSTEEMQGRSFLDLIHPDSLDYVGGIHRKMILGKSFLDRYETYMTIRGGDTLCFEIRVKKIRFRGRRAFLVNMIGLDQRKQKELWNRRTQKTEALIRMASGLRQEFAGCLSILDEEALKPLVLESLTESNLSKYLRGIESLRERGNEIIRDLTILSKAERDESDAVLLDLKKIVQNAVASTRGWWREAIERCGSEINVKTYLRNIAPVRGNPNEIEDVFRRMISNAIDALPEGGEIYLTTEENFGFAYVYIQDNGVGIPDDIKEQIFDPFFTTKSGSRQGLGLTTAYAIIDQHWGEIEVMSNVGQGSTFIIKLPIAKKPPSRKARVARNRIKHSHILIISSGGMFKDLLCQLFVSKGGKVTSASNGGEGIKFLKKNKFDLVIADLNVPYLESSRIIPRLKKTGRGLPVALAVGDEKWRSPQTLRKLGVDLVISRPLEMERTLGLISQALSMRK